MRDILSDCVVLLLLLQGEVMEEYEDVRRDIAEKVS